eukprot:6617074-Prorocentrum_lima.AAC.1
MTSSLVGSEMCIRDRPFGTLLEEGDEDDDDDEDYPHDALVFIVKNKCICLLYTSDAADDM